MPDIALRFCLSHDAVSTVIPGMRTADHAERNVAAAESGRLETSDLARLRHHRWVRNVYRTGRRHRSTRSDRAAAQIARRTMCSSMRGGSA